MAEILDPSSTSPAHAPALTQERLIREVVSAFAIQRRCRENLGDHPLIETLGQDLDRAMNRLQRFHGKFGRIVRFVDLTD